MAASGFEDTEKLWTIWVDLGFIGIDGYVGKHTVKIPHKKSKNNPLTPLQKQENKGMSSERIAVENAIGNQKRYFILRNENRSANQLKIQEEVWICAGLANFKSMNKLMS